MSQKEPNPNQDAINIIVLIGFCVLMWAAWEYARVIIVAPLFGLNLAYIYVIEFIKGLNEGGLAIKDFVASFFNGVRSPSTDISLSDFIFVRDAVGHQVKWLFVPMIGYMAYRIKRDMRGNIFSRRFSLGGEHSISLAAYQAQHFKVASYSAHFQPDGRDIAIRPADTPMEFLRNNNIPFENAAFTEHDLEVTLPEVFKRQLGDPWTGFARANLYVQTVTILLALHFLMRKNSLAEREAINVAWAGGKDGTEAMKQLVEKYSKDEKVVYVIDKICGEHGFANVAIIKFLLEARLQSGVFASSDLNYIKQLDRSLWYTLSNIGRRRFFIEAAGPIAHYFAEVVTGKRLIEPRVDKAVDGVVSCLKDHGLESLEDFFSDKFADMRD